MNKRGDVITDENMRTNIPGVYAAGDIRVKLLRQVITATADGAIAATDAEHYIENKA
jgi:thioredoxin reductase (NADPH)